MEFPDIYIRWNYLAVFETKNNIPGLHHNLLLNYNQKNRHLFQHANFTSDCTIAIAHAKKKKSSDASNEGK